MGDCHSKRSLASAHQLASSNHCPTTNTDQGTSGHQTIGNMATNKSGRIPTPNKKTPHRTASGIPKLPKSQSSAAHLSSSAGSTPGSSVPRGQNGKTPSANRQSVPACETQAKIEFKPAHSRTRPVSLYSRPASKSSTSPANEGNPMVSSMPTPSIVPPRVAVALTSSNTEAPAITPIKNEPTGCKLEPPSSLGTGIASSIPSSMSFTAGYTSTSKWRTSRQGHREGPYTRPSPSTELQPTAFPSGSCSGAASANSVMTASLDEASNELSHLVTAAANVPKNTSTGIYSPRDSMNSKITSPGTSRLPAPKSKSRIMSPKTPISPVTPKGARASLQSKSASESVSTSPYSARQMPSGRKKSSGSTSQSGSNLSTPVGSCHNLSPNNQQPPESSRKPKSVPPVKAALRSQGANKPTQLKKATPGAAVTKDGKVATKPGVKKVGQKISNVVDHTSLSSLNSDDLMLNTEVGIDDADDDIMKDIGGTEKEDPFLCTSSPAAPVGTSKTTHEDNRQPDEDVTPVDSIDGDKDSLDGEPEIPTEQKMASSADKMASSADDDGGDTFDDSNWLSVGHLSDVPGVDRSHGSLAGDGAVGDGSNPDLSLCTRARRPVDLMSMSMDFSSSRLRHTRHLLGMTSPTSSSRTTSFLCPPRPRRFSEDPQEAHHITSAEHRQWQHDVTNIKLTCLRLKRMLIDDDGHLPPFISQIQRSTSNGPNSVSEPGTPLNGTLSGIDDLSWSSQLIDDQLENASKSQLIQDFVVLKGENERLKAEVKDKNQIIALLQQQMTKYTCYAGKSSSQDQLSAGCVPSCSDVPVSPSSLASPLSAEPHVVGLPKRPSFLPVSSSGDSIANSSLVTNTNTENQMESLSSSRYSHSGTSPST